MAGGPDGRGGRDHGGEGLRLEETGPTEAVRELAPEWDRFRRKAGIRTPFLRPDFLALWATTIGRADRSRIVTARRGGELVGLGPFMLTDEPFGPLSVRGLRFIGNNIGYPGDVMYSDIAAVPPRGPVVRAILEHVAGWRANAWDLGFVCPASETCALAPRILGSAETASVPERVPYVVRSLPATWDAFLHQLSGEVRRNFRRRLRRLSEAGSVDVRVASDPREVRRTILEMIGNQERWLRGTPKENWIGGEPVKRFLPAAGELLAAEDAFLAFALELDGQPVAWNLGARADGCYYEQLASYDRTYREYAPGVLLGMLVAQRLIERGFTSTELGPGFDERKQRLGAMPVDYEHLRGYRGWTRAAARLYRTLRPWRNGM